MILSGARRRTPALVSVHDVMPRTLERVREIVDRLEDAGAAPVTLLVSPGFGWSARDAAALKRLEDRGHALAGHGWRHECPHFSGVFHRLHGLVMSKNEAEHLSCSGREVQQMMSRCFAWFAEMGLKPPALYVPPAWAMGAVGRDVLKRLPYRFYETLAGVYDSETGRFHPLPLTAYLAARPLDAPFLRAFNRLNLAAARKTGLPWRLAIHPPDPDLPLGNHIFRDAGRMARPMSYSDLPNYGR